MNGTKNLVSGFTSHDKEILAICVSLVLGYILNSFIPKTSPDDLHLAAVVAAQAAEPTLACGENPSLPATFRSHLVPSATPHFMKIVGNLNRLAELLSLGDARYNRCLPASDASNSRLETQPQKITRLTADSIEHLDVILSEYHKNTDLPRSAVRNLENLRSALVRIAYTHGHLPIRGFVAFADVVPIILSLLYMLLTFQAMRSALPEGQEFFHAILFALTMLVGTVSVFAASLDSFIAPYSLLVLMFVSVLYTRRVSTNLDGERHCGLLSFVRLLSWGAYAYFTVLFAVAIAYLQAELSVGAIPFRLARLNIANLFFTLSFTVFTFHLIRTGARSRQRLMLGTVTFVLGPVAFVVALFNYFGWLGPQGYPGNILYRLLPNTWLTRAPLIEIAAARLMISIPLIIVIARRLYVRGRDTDRISKFLKSQHDPSADVTLELLPGFEVNLSQRGVLFPNSDSRCAPMSTATDSLEEGSESGSMTGSGLPTLGNLLRITRPANVLMALLLASISYLSTASTISILSFLILLATTACAVAGSFILNDVADQAVDRVNHPARPLAAGTLSPKFAFVVGMILLCAAPALAVSVNPLLASFWLCVSMLSVFYSFYLKPRSGLVANVLSASLTTGICFVGCFITKSIGSMVEISFAVFLAALAREIAKDVEDLAGDRRFRKRTLPLLVHPSIATRTAILFAAGQIVASYIPYAYGGAGDVYLWGITFANALLLHGLYRAYRVGTARLVQRAGKLSMAMYLVTYVSFVWPVV